MYILTRSYPPPPSPPHFFLVINKARDAVDDDGNTTLPHWVLSAQILFRSAWEQTWAERRNLSTVDLEALPFSFFVCFLSLDAPQR